MDHRPNSGLSSPQQGDRLSTPPHRGVYDRHHAGNQGDIADTPTTYFNNRATTANPRQDLTTSLSRGQTSPSLPRQSRSEVLRRHMVEASTQKFRPPKRRFSVRPLIMSFSTIALVSAITLVTANLIKDNSPAGVLAGVITHQVDDDAAKTPEETAPIDLQDYTVESHLPRILRIEKLNVEARIQPIGIGLGNVLKSPTNIHDAGWYTGSAKPGEKGAILVNGYVSGPTAHGAFRGLNSLKKGDFIQLERGDGKLFTYYVYSTAQLEHDEVDLNSLMQSAVPGDSGLNLITTGGRFNVTTNEFEDRTVVFTLLEE